ncbi:hypothetical protein PHLCEN_2v1315 [Hermanssonia centrifuga]|uniref:Uncharacterized protein n=1 Tax=Hermanssonia centrifuga TaxID=98765 RepID=A0A2R6S3I0_9APHY|nr:hypothetical protein PHLCEN_2v1315 [Hermanssonia centrifuga]
MSQIPPSWSASPTTQELYNFCLDHADLPPPDQKSLAHLSATALHTHPISQGLCHHPSPSPQVINISIDRNCSVTSNKQFVGATIVLISLDAMQHSNSLLTETYPDLAIQPVLGPKGKLPPHYINL